MMHGQKNIKLCFVVAIGRYWEEKSQMDMRLKLVSTDILRMVA
jgi:hypothetical protein